MAIQRLGKDNIDVYTIETHPSQSFFFTSGSDLGIITTGSMPLMPSKLSGIKAQYNPNINPSLWLGTPSFYDPTIEGGSVDMGSMPEMMSEAGYLIREGLLTNIEDTLWDPESEDYGTGFGADMTVTLGYMAVINRASTAAYLTKSFDIRRINPIYHLNQDEMKFQVIKDVLIPRYAGSTSPQGNYNFSYTNYHTLNFFTASTMGVQKYAGWTSATEYAPHLGLGATGHDQSVLIYNNTRFWAGSPDRTVEAGSYGIISLPAHHPQVQDTLGQVRDFDREFHTDLGTWPPVDVYSGLSNPSNILPGPPYTPYGDFTIDFYINPRYLQGDEKDYRAGTIMHISSTFAVSLVSGSSKNTDGRADQFRIMLQLSHSAEFSPSSCSLSPLVNKGSTQGDPSATAAMTHYPDDMIFLSNNNSLKHNHWHHVAIRWGTDLVNDGSGSFIIDGVEKGTFNIPSRSIFQLTFNDNGSHGTGDPVVRPVTNPAQRGEPNALFIGNFMEGTNNADWASPPEQIRYFFNTASVQFENIDHHPWNASWDTATRAPHIRRGQPMALVDKIDLTGVGLPGPSVDGANFTLRVRTTEGGSGTSIIIKFYEDPGSPGPSSGEIHVKNQSGDEDTRDNLILAFNGTSDSTKVVYGSADAGDSTDGIAGVAAYAGTTNTRVTVKATGNSNLHGKTWRRITFSDWEYPDGTSWRNLVRKYPTFYPYGALSPGVFGVTAGIFAEDNEPKTITFNHPLRAEIHEIKIHDTYRTTDEIEALTRAGPKDLSDILFYLPPFFVMESPMRRFIRSARPPGSFPGYRDVVDYRSLWFQSGATSYLDSGDSFRYIFYTGSDAPINAQLAEQVAGLSVSVENFTREFIQGAYPRLYHLTESYAGHDSNSMSLNILSHDQRNGGGLNANSFIQSAPVNNKRNFLIMPNDNGLFSPNFDLLASGTYNAGEGDLTPEVIMGHLSGSVTGTIDQPAGRFVTDQGVIDLSMINLRNLVDGNLGTSAALVNKAPFSGFSDNVSDVTNTVGKFPGMEIASMAIGVRDIVGQQIKATGPSPGGITMVVSSSDLGRFPEEDEDGPVLGEMVGVELFSPNPTDLVSSKIAFASADWNAISALPYFGATGDSSSNLVSLFQISNLYYGDRIMPKTFTLIDSNFTGSNGALKLTLKDDGVGGIYRADCLTPHAEWNNVGNILYNEGIIFIKSPHIYRIGKENFEIGLTGYRDVHVMHISVPCPAGQINVSHNPTFKPIPPSLDPNETAEEFVYITGIDLHDDNLNVIARATLAQPLMKRISDEFLFRIKIDF